MKRVLSLILAFMVVISGFAVSPSAIEYNKEYFNADSEAYYDGWFYYANGGRIYRETNTGEERTYYSSDKAEKIGVSAGYIYILRENGISRFDISKKSETMLVGIKNIKRFSLADGILYYLAGGVIFAKDLYSGKTEEIAAAEDFWLESAEKLSYMTGDGYINTVDFLSGETKKEINKVSFLPDDLTVSSGFSAGSHSGAAPQAISIKKLREKFPAGKYWNHGSGANNPDGYTSTPCNHHNSSGCEYDGSCGCNSFNSAIQCMGYAEKCGRDVTDANPRTSGEWEKSTNKSAIDNIKAGDIVRYKNDGHSVYVIRVSGDTVTITDCNSDYHCIIRWDATISKSTLKSSFTYIRIAPFDAGYYTMKLNPGEGKCSKPSVEVMDGEAYGELPVPTREGYDFTGWYSAENGGTKVTASSTVDLDKVKELYAHWELKTYAIVYDANGGEKAPETQTKKHFSSIVLSGSSPARYGYTFDLWNTSPDGSGTQYKKNQTYKEESNLTLYAQWIPNQVRLTFNFNGGYNSELGRNVTFGRKYSEEKDTFSDGYKERKLPEAVQDGYDFTGWYLDKNGGGLVTDDTVVSVAEYHTLYAHWAEKQYLISYSGKGNGMWPENHYKLHFSSAWISNVVPTSTGMTFEEWNTEENGSGKSYHPGDIYSANEPLHLYAQWDRDKYDVTYNANGGSGAPSSQTKEYGRDLKLSSKEPKRTGYKFIGWSDENGIIYYPEFIYKKNEPLELSAVWEANKYIITFDYLGGACETRQKEVTFDGTYGALPESSKAGYIFDGWYTEESGGVKVDPGDKVKIAVDTALYARWILKTYDITFVSQGENVPAPMKKNHGTDLKLTTDIPANTGYEFVEWNTAEDGSGEAFVSGGIYGSDAPVILYAIWKNAEYAVSYNANGGTDAPAIQAKPYAQDIKLSSEIPERENYTFAGWNTAENGSGADYQPGAVYSANENAELYAKWKPNEFKAFLQYDGNCCEHKVVYGKKYGEMPKPEKDGFTFLCWQDSDGRTVNPGEIFRGNGDVYLNAVWLNDKDLASGETYYAAFIDNGRVAEKVPYSSGTESIREPVPADIYGYISGWEDYSLKDGGTVVFAKRTPVEFSAEFIADGKTVSTVKYTIEESEIAEPEIPAKDGYSAEWSKYTLGGNIKIEAIYTAIEYEAKFAVKGKIISTVNYTVGAKSISVPRIPEREGYSGRWEKFEIVPGGITVNAVYSMNNYSVHFIANGAEVGSTLFTIDSDKIYEPEVPLKNGYSGSWEEYSLAARDITVNAVYTPNDYYVIFKVDGNEVERVKYTFGASKIEVPEVPQKAGYTAEWEGYSLGYADSAVNAIYTPIVYTATFVADGIILGTESFTVKTTALHPPAAPEKYGYNVRWQSYVIGPGDMTIEAVYTLNYAIGIRNFKYEKRYDYKTTVIFTAEPVGMTDECEIRWYLNGVISGTGETFEVYQATEKYTVRAEIIEKGSGKVLAKTETEKVYIYNTFFQRLIAFFRALFKALPVVEQ